MISPTARQACNVVVFGLPNRKCGTFAQHRAGIDRSAEHKYLQFPHFGPDLFVDMVGVTGSIPVAPTINAREIRLLLDRRADLPRLNIYAATLTSVLPKFLPCSMPRNDAGAFSSPSTISSRYLRRPVRTHSPTSRKKSACFAAKSETMNPRRSRRLRSTENMSGPGIGLVALYCAMSPHTGMRAKSLSSGHTVCCTAPPTFSK